LKKDSTNKFQGTSNQKKQKTQNKILTPITHNINIAKNTKNHKAESRKAQQTTNLLLSTQKTFWNVLMA